MSAVLAPERPWYAVCGRDEFGASLPVSEERRTEREVRERLQDLEREMRRCEAEMIATLAEADGTGSFRLDGHRTLRQWAGATARWSDAELRDRVRTVRLVRDVPEVLQELRAGRVGIAQIREIARLRANPRCGDQVIEAAPKLIEHAENEPFFEFRVISRRWESLRDEDGAHKSHEAAHAGRRVGMSEMDTTFHMAAQWGAVQGSSIREILERFERAEFDAEWDELRARCGDDANVSMLERTAMQRRADAMYAIFLAAASTPPDAQRPEPVVNIVVDQLTFEEHVKAATSGTTPKSPDPTDFTRRCETLAGVPVDPFTALAAAAVGHVRRVVMNAKSVVIDMGRTQRLYRGSARLAALLQGVRCTWPGCGRSTRIHIDHVDEWQDDGATDQANAGRECNPHNLIKSTGYRVTRDEQGRWHTYRPDGSEIVPV